MWRDRGLEELSNLPEAPQCRIQIQVNRSAHGLNFHVVPQSLLSWGLRGDADPGEGGLCLHSCRRPCSGSSPPLRLPLSSSTYHVTASAATAVLSWPSLLTMPPATASGPLSWVQCGHGEDRGLRHSRQHMPLSPHHSGHTSGPQDAVTATSPSSVPHCCCPRPSIL